MTTRWFCACVVVALVAMAAGSKPFDFPANPSVTQLLDKLDLQSDIVTKHKKFMTDYFVPARIEEVVPGRVYQMIGATLGYATVVVAGSELLLIDSPESYTEAKKQIDEFRAIPAIGTKPFRTIILTLFHGDHIWGLKAFLEDPNNGGVSPKVYMHEKSPGEAANFDTFNAFKFPRLARQFGLFVPEPYHIHDGSAPRLLPDPTHPGTLNLELLHFNTVNDVINRTVGDLEVQFRSAPGYTVDQITVYFPDLNVYHIADVFYFSFLNVYTLRGEPARNAETWAQDLYRAARITEPVDWYIASHTWPFKDPERLEYAADSIKFIHDQTLRMMMKGIQPDVICRNMTLPPEQRARQSNWEIYGIYETACRAVYDFYVGWFSGEVEDLFAQDRIARAKMLVRIIEPARVIKEARKAYDAGNYRGSMELSSMVYLIDRDNRDAKELRTMSMVKLTDQTFSVNARNYLMTSIMEDWGLAPQLIINTRPGLKNLPLDAFFKNIQAHVDAAKLEDDRVGELVLYLVLGPSDVYKLTLRNGVLLYQKVNTAPTGNSVYTLTEAELKTYMVSDTLAGQGDESAFRHFFSYIDLTDQAAP